MKLRGGRFGALAVVLVFVFTQASLAPAVYGTGGVVGTANGAVGATDTSTVAVSESTVAVSESTVTARAGRTTAVDARTGTRASSDATAADRGGVRRQTWVAFPNGSVGRNRTNNASANESRLAGGEATATGAEPAADSQTATRRADPGIRAIRADAVHRMGVTGDGVRVGVIDGGFDAHDPSIADHVAGVRRLGGHGRRAHGTAVAAVVSETAPNSTLYLASVGDAPTADTYRRAVEWLLANDADVIVDSGSYFPRSVADAERITAAADRAADDGVVFVTSAGNYANRHWAGNGTSEGWVSFHGDVQADFLNRGNVTSGAVSLRLRWNSTADYDLYLYRYVPGPDRIVAKSARRQNGPETRRSEAIDVMVPRGRYYAAVYAANGTDDPGRVSLFSPYKSLKYAVAAGSVVAPATSDRVISVGAVDAAGHTYAFSSRGDNGTVDIGAPGEANVSGAGTFVGTSAAAPYVAGTAALMRAENASLTPAQVEFVLERTAVVNDGRLDALAAVRTVAQNPPPQWLAVDATDRESANQSAENASRPGTAVASGNATIAGNATAGAAGGTGNATATENATAAGNATVTGNATAGGTATATGNATAAENATAAGNGTTPKGTPVPETDVTSGNAAASLDSAAPTGLGALPSYLGAAPADLGATPSDLLTVDRASVPWPDGPAVADASAGPASADVDAARSNPEAWAG
ncbi:MAG: S8 family serine peptidase [Salinigranum sp.]